MKPWIGAIVGAMFPLSFIAMTWLPDDTQKHIADFITQYAAPMLMVLVGALFGYKIVATGSPKP